MKIISSVLILFGLCTKWATGDTAAAAATYFGNANSTTEQADSEYTTWLGENGSLYVRHIFLASTDSPKDGMAVHWTIKGEEIQLAVAVHTTGWLGFGIAEAGGMKGADIFLFDSETEKVVDSYVLDENVKPLPDDCQSWKVVDSFIGDEYLIVELTRALDTKDTQDRALVPDGEVFVPATRVIAAWGESPTPIYHGSNFAMGSIRFFGTTNTDSLIESFRSAMELEANGTFFIGASNYSVPSNETTYQMFCLSYDDLLSQGVLSSEDMKKHIIGLEPVIDPRAVKHVHHFLVFGSPSPTVDECDLFSQTETLYVWAPGAPPNQPPPQVGIPLGGGEAGYLSFAIQVHYDNKEFRTDIVDSSGVNLYYTSLVRQYDQGVLAIGDPLVQAQPGILSIDGGLTQHSFSCPVDCTQKYFKEEVTVFAELLHMHENGRAMQSQQIRNGGIIRRSVSQYFDFKQQGAYAVVQEPFQLKPGDAFNVICGFDAEQGERWGLASADEMCMSFLLYYPRQIVPLGGNVTIQPQCGVGVEEFLPGCESVHQVTPDFTRFERSDREFGLEMGACNATTRVGNTATNNNAGQDSTSATSGTSFLRFGRTVVSLVVLLVLSILF